MTTNLDTSKTTSPFDSKESDELKEMAFLNHESGDELSVDLSESPSADGTDDLANTGSDLASNKNDSSGDDDEDKIEFTPEMTRNIFRLRAAVVVVLVAAGVITGIVYSIIKGKETEDFELNYEGASSKILEAFQGIVTEKLQAVTSLAIAATAHSLDHDDHWPMSTLSFFQDRATATRMQSGSLFVGMVPMVTIAQREMYENYTVQDPKGWIQEGLDAQAHWDPTALRVNLPLMAENVHPGFILADDWELGIVKDEGYGPYFPVWQASPIVNCMVNFNLGSIPIWVEEIATSMRDQALIVGRLLTPPPGTSSGLTKLLDLCLLLPSLHPKSHWLLSADNVR
jgi:hypothetical protein